MDKKTILKVYEDLPNWARGVVVVGGLAVVYIVGSTIYRKVTSITSAVDEQRKLNQMNDDLNKKLKNGQQATYDDSQYNIFADEATVAFNGFRLDIIPCSTYLGLFCQSNTFRELRPVIEKLQNDVDFLKLQQAFGTRTITKPITDITKTLPELVRYQLNHYEIERLNTIMSDNGITYQF
jgi:hypothetical protein